MLKLYSYFRSSASWRVRIALALKNLSYETETIHLLEGGGEQHSREYRSINPQGLVPTLELSGDYISQSIAIIEYLEERYPEPSLLSGDAMQRAQIRRLAHMVAMDIHPLNNLKVQRYLTDDLALEESDKVAWVNHWIVEGFTALEALLGASEMEFCVGSSPSLADCCLVPQVYNARRFNVDMSKFPRISAIDNHCMSLEAFADTHPDRC